MSELVRIERDKNVVKAWQEPDGTVFLSETKSNGQVVNHFRFGPEEWKVFLVRCVAAVGSTPAAVSAPAAPEIEADKEPEAPAAPEEKAKGKGKDQTEKQE